MSFGNYEGSRFSGEPVNLYHFKYGENDNEFYAYTDAEQPITHPSTGPESVIYAPIPIDRGKITSSGSLDKSNMKISTPYDCALADLYLSYPPSYVTSLIMYQGHVSDADQDFKVVWSGRVMSCARRGSQAEFTCEPISTSLRRNGLRRRYQFGCPHVLYGDDCRADKARATASVTVQSVSGSRITVASDWADIARAAKYVQGLAEWIATSGGREIRTILRAENGGRTFLLSGSPRGLVAGSALDLVLGCNHKAGIPAQPDGDCAPLHDNILNFGGQPYIPFKSPIGFVNNFY